MKFRVKSTLKYSVQRMTPTKAVRIALLVISDALILNIASFLALWVRFEFHFEQLVRETEYLNNILRFAPYYTAFGLIVFALFKLYTSLWQFASIDEFLKIILACFIVDAGGYAGMHLMHLGIPRSHPVLNGIFLVIMITGVRFSYRFMRQYRRANNSCRRTMIIGAGQAATVALREFRASTHSENKVVCLIDDDKSKWGQYLLGVKVVGGRGDILGAVKNTILTRLLWQCRRQVSVCAAKFWISARTPRAGLKRFRVFFSLRTARSASIKSAMLKLRIFSGASRFALTLPIFAAMSEAEWSLLRAEAAQSEANCAGSLLRMIPKC